MRESTQATTEQPDLPRRRSRIYLGWWIVAAGFLAQVINAAAHGWVLTILVRPMEVDLGWSRTELMGALTVAALITGGISAPLGPLIDRHGTRLFMTGSMFFGGACLILLGFVTEPWQYYVLLGAGIGLATPGMHSLGPVVAIANWFIRKRTLALTLFMIGSPFTGIFLSPGFAWLADYAGWRMSWVVLGLIAWLGVPLCWLAVRRRPEDIGLLPDGDNPQLATRTQTAVENARARLASESLWTVGEALRTRTFWLLVSAFTLVSFPLSSIFVHMAPYVTGKGFSAAESAYTLSMYGFGTLAGRFIWGYIIDRFGLHSSLSVFGFAYGFGILAFMAPSSLWAIYFMTFVLGVSVAGGQLFQTQTFADYWGRDIVGALTGYAGLFLTIARAVGPLFAAMAFDATQNYVFAFVTFTAACFISGVAFIMATPPVHPSKRKAATRALS